MDYSQAFAISAAGMTAERARVDVAVINLANANTVQGTDSDAFQPLRAVARTLNSPAPVFADLMDFYGNVGQTPMLALPVVTVELSDAPPRLVYDPGHPLANTKGLVAYPGVDTAGEMVTMMSATRAYEANVAAMSAARTMALKALDIGN